MNTPSLEYQPISCDFYDHIEIHTIRKTWVQLEYTEEGASVMEICKLLSTKTLDKEEFVILSNKKEVRMDHIKMITPLNPALDMRVNLLEKLEFNDWANRAFITHLLQIHEYPSSAGLKMSHILNAHDSWNRRILHMQSRFENWEDQSHDNWISIQDEIHQESMNIMKHSQLDRIIHYQHSEDHSSQSSIADIIYHVVNHSTYHRGQISEILSSAGQRSLSSDYIIFSRNKYQ